MSFIAIQFVHLLCNVDETVKYKFEFNATTELIATMKIRLNLGII